MPRATGPIHYIEHRSPIKASQFFAVMQAVKDDMMLSALNWIPFSLASLLR